MESLEEFEQWLGVKREEKEKRLASRFKLEKEEVVEIVPVKVEMIDSPFAPDTKVPQYTVDQEGTEKTFISQSGQFAEEWQKAMNLMEEEEDPLSFEIGKVKEMQMTSEGLKGYYRYKILKALKNKSVSDKVSNDEIKASEII